ncbi:hypothetical protein ABFT23_11630 [Nocardioides sp. C4-1]|uniref:hypothetical protein n=1 Tax=Nocardioides sp. C4-1 TaxID=3151851 RepID=UPI0032660E08
MAGLPPLTESPGPLDPLGLPRFAPVARLDRVDVVQPGTALPPAPYAAASTPVAGPARVVLRSGDDVLTATWDGARVALEVVADGRASRHVSRRHGRGDDPTELAVALTGPFVTAFVRERGDWVARAVVDLAEHLHAPDVHDEGWLAGLTADAARAGTFGQLGFRDVRVVSHADGAPVLDPDDDARVLLTATGAGPGGFRTGHTSVWSLDAVTLDLRHRGDLFFRRPERAGVLGDHATHLVRHDDSWLVATSTWGDFDRARNPRVTTTLASTADDVTRGSHVLDTVALALPVDGLRSVGTWDPHLALDDDHGWLVGFVSATRFFRFHPALASGPALDDLALRGSASSRTATEGPTLLRGAGAWWLAASDGRDGPRRHRAAYPVFDLDLHERGRLDAFYPTNLPWPSVVDLPPERGGPLLLGFNGRRTGGALLGYGTHGALVVQRPS